MTDTLLQFPCDFPIKVMGRAHPEFESAVLAIVRRHAPELVEERIAVRESNKGTYTAITFTVEAHSRQQLDALYQDLTACEQVVMAL